VKIIEEELGVKWAPWTTLISKVSPVLGSVSGRTVSERSKPMSTVNGISVEAPVSTLIFQSFPRKRNV